jgi:hypothetical protein
MIRTEKVALDTFRLFHCDGETSQTICYSDDCRYKRPKIQSCNVHMSIMHLASLNVDILLYLMKFIDPVDRFNLVLSGILKGLEKVNREMNPPKRYSNHFLI